MAFTLRSPAFVDLGPIPDRYTAEGDNLSPPLAWSGAPPAAKSFVIVVEDPDAPSGVFGHWGICNLRGEAIAEGEGHGDTPDQARNGFGNAHYDGPDPPKAHGVHHYRFRVAALGIERLDLEIVPSVAELWAMAEPYVLAQAELIGTFERA
jgi:Raf kinase inhibitor-like YbhB/YbcL family protein